MADNSPRHGSWSWLLGAARAVVNRQRLGSLVCLFRMSIELLVAFAQCRPICEGLGGRAGGRRLYIGTRARPELDLLIALRSYVLDDPDEFRRAAVVDEVADRALFVAGADDNHLV